LPAATLPTFYYGTVLRLLGTVCLLILARQTTLPGGTKYTVFLNIL